MRYPADRLLIALVGLGIGAWQPFALAAPALSREPAVGVPQEPAAGVRPKSSSKPPTEEASVNLFVGEARASADTVAPTREIEDRVQSPIVSGELGAATRATTTSSVGHESVPGEDRSAQLSVAFGIAELVASSNLCPRNLAWLLVGRTSPSITCRTL